MDAIIVYSLRGLADLAGRFFYSPQPWVIYERKHGKKFFFNGHFNTRSDRLYRIVGVFAEALTRDTAQTEIVIGYQLTVIGYRLTDNGDSDGDSDGDRDSKAF